jgi:two-component system, sensor histidine kinase
MAGAPWTRWQRWIALYVENESQVDQQFDVIGKSAATSLVAGAVLAIVASIRMPSPLVIGWSACLSCAVVLWLLLRTAFRTRNASASHPGSWAALHTVMVTLMGLLWGLCIWVFEVPQDFNGSIAVVAVQTVVAMTGWLFFSAFFPALLMYSLGMFIPAAIAYALHWDFAHAALCLVLHVVFVMQGRKVIEVIRIRHEKEVLVLQLQQENSAKQLALAAAQEATAAKTRFFAAISHDVRQPLYGLSLLVDTTTRALLPTQRRDVQQRMRQSVAMLDGLFTQLLEVSQLDAHALQPKIEPVDLAAFMIETARTFEAQLRQANSSLVLEVESVCVLADRAWLQRIVFNLLGNALNHAPQGELKFFALLEGDHVSLRVQDQGPGIAEDRQEMIFEEFYRAPDQATTSKGFGLGLPIVRRLARAMHTDVKLRSSVDRGSTFWLDLPLVKDWPSHPRGAPRQAAEPDCPTGSLLMGARIGLVEDDETVGQALSALLTSWGAQTRWARGSPEALGWAEPVDALVVDYELKTGDPMNGVEVAAALRERWAQAAREASPGSVPVSVPVLVASSLNLDPAQSAGFDALVKPLAPIQLRAWLLNAIAPRLPEIAIDNSLGPSRVALAPHLCPLHL